LLGRTGPLRHNVGWGGATIGEEQVRGVGRHARRSRARGRRVGALALVYEKTFAQLSPVIGANGVRGIFVRALEVVQPEQPLLRSFVVGSEPKKAASTLATSLSAAPAADARSAAIALYASFFGLIVTFIGFELTIRLLHDAWPRVDMKET
jgi:hypothetical protein